MTKAGKLGRLRRAIRRGVARIKQILTYDRRRRRAIRRLLAEQGATVMFDDVDVAAIPENAPAVAGYVDGRWPTSAELATRFPHVPRLSIAVSPADDAHCLDVETGDARPGDVPAWLDRQFASWAGEDWRPCVYVDKSEAPAVIAACEAAGIRRGRYRLWVADWTYQAHVCSPTSCGATFTAEATQWTDRGPGGCDQSLCAAGFFPGAC